MGEKGYFGSGRDCLVLTGRVIYKLREAGRMRICGFLKGKELGVGSLRNVGMCNMNAIKFEDGEFSKCVIVGQVGNSLRKMGFFKYL